MTLQTTGPINTADITGEFGGTNPFSPTEYYGASSGLPASGTIKWSDFYGESSVISLNLVISANTNNYNVFSAATALYGAALPGPTAVTLTINAGVVVGSAVSVSGVNQNRLQTIAGPAITSGTFPAGSTLTIINNGEVIGAGGGGGSYLTPNATTRLRGGHYAGGDALLIQLTTSITNNNLIAGGGGGGAGGDGSGGNSIGGGGGAGSVPGYGGFGYPSAAGYGSRGTKFAGGLGTHGNTYPATGGALGQNGIYGGNFNSTGHTGRAGAYVDGASFVTWLVNGDRRGVAV